LTDFLTPLAILGIVVFGIAVVLLVFLFVREGFELARLVRRRRVSVQLAWGEKPVASTPPWLEPDESTFHEAPERPTRQGDGADVKTGWGFD
jgi:hypothetical protein